MKLLVVSCGIGKPSSTRWLADRLAEATESALREECALEVRVAEIRELAMDLAHHLVTGVASPMVRDVIANVAAADGLIAATPIFAASYSGLFKSFFDVLDDAALAGKPVLIAASGGTWRHALALEHAIRPLFVQLRALTVPTAVYAVRDPDDGSAVELTARIFRAAHELAALMRARHSFPLVTADPGCLAAKQATG